MSVGFSITGFFADNSGELTNIKLDELTSKLGLTVKFGPAFSPWNNGINEQNHATADLLLKQQTTSVSISLDFLLFS